MRYKKRDVDISYDRWKSKFDCFLVVVHFEYDWIWRVLWQRQPDFMVIATRCTCAGSKALPTMNLQTKYPYKKYDLRFSWISGKAVYLKRICGGLTRFELFLGVKDVGFDTQNKKLWRVMSSYNTPVTSCRHPLDFCTMVQATSTQAFIYSLSRHASHRLNGVLISSDATLAIN